MGHVALRHPTRGMTLGELAQVEVQAASRTVPEEAPQKVKAVALKRFAFDRACEIEADGYAVRLLKDSGADPATLVAYLRTLPPSRHANKENVRLSGSGGTYRVGAKGHRRSRAVTSGCP